MFSRDIVKFDATVAEFCSLVTADHERQENLPRVAISVFGSIPMQTCRNLTIDGKDNES